MTINLADNDPRVSYSVAEGVTQTSFTVSFEFFNEEDLNVYVDGTLKTLTTDYTVTGGDGSTGSVSISVTGASGGSTVVVTRSIDLERTTDFPTSGAFNISALNTELDRFVAINADLKDQIDRSLKLSDYDDATALTLPDLDSRKGKSLVFNSTTGDIEVGPSSTALNSIADYIPEINTVGDDLNAGSFTAGSEYDFGSITAASVGSTGSPDGFIVSVYNNLADITSVAGNSSNVNTVASISANITTVADNDANITSVAGNISNVNTVAGISSDVTTVAGISSDVTAVVADATDIGTVATDIANVNTVAGISANVTTVAGISSDVTAVAADATDIGTVAGLATEIGALGAITSDITSVNSNASNITAVAGNNTNITTVAGISSDVTTVATNNANVTAVAGNATNINTVASDTADINALGSISANITTVAGVAADVTTVAGISANTTTVAGISSDVTTVAGNSANVTTVAGISSDVTTVAGDSADIQTVATNLSSINDFADKYRVGTSDPTTDNDEGDLFYNTTSDTLKVYNGTAWEAGVTAGSGFLPLTGGTLTGAIVLNADPSVALGAATKQYVDNEVAGIVDSAPAALDTLNELAAALGDDANFSTTVTNSIATKLPLAGGTMTGAITFAAGQTFDGRDVSADGTKLDGIESGADVTDTTNVVAALTAGTNITIAGDGTISSTDTNTTYTADGNYGMTLSGTAFRLENDRRRNANEDVWSGNANDYTHYDENVGIRWYTASAEEMRLENDGDLHVDGNITAYSTTVSDERLKTDIERIDGALDKICALSGYTFTYKHDGKASAGVVAQEVEKVLPSAVIEKELAFQGEEGEQYKIVQYDQLHGLLIEAIKELKAEIEELKNGSTK